MQIKKVLEYCGDFLGCWLRLLICPHVAAMYIHRYGFKFTTLRDFLFSQPCTNDITTFSFISSPPALSPDFTEWLTWAVTGKEQEGSLGLCILQSSTSAAWPLDLPGQTPLCLYSILQCCSPSWAPLTGAALFPLHPACRAEEFRGIQVGLYQLWASQLGAALCRCLPGLCCESSESASTSSYFTLETVLTASLACLIVLKLYLWCWRVLGYRKGHWGGGPDSLCVTLFLTVMTDELLI